MTEITVKLFPYYPDDMWIGGYIVENFHKGLDCIREIMAKGYKPSVVRLYDKPDVDHNYGSVKIKRRGSVYVLQRGRPERNCTGYGREYS